MNIRLMCQDIISVRPLTKSKGILYYYDEYKEKMKDRTNKINRIRKKINNK